MSKWKELRENFDWKEFRDKTGKAFGIASDISYLLLQLRAKPRWTDYFALGLKSVDIGSKIVDELSFREEEEDLYYSPHHWVSHQEESWGTLGFALRDNVGPYLVDVEPVENYYNKHDEKITSQLFLSRLEGTDIQIAFSSGTDLSPDKIFQAWARVKDFKELRQALGKKIWERLGVKLVRSEGVGDLIPLFLEECYVTKDMKSLLKRVSLFLDEKRSYMVEGVPGSGKTTAVLWVAKELGLTTFQIPYTSILPGGHRSETLERIHSMQPQCIIIDDFDRLSQEIATAIPLLEQFNTLSQVLFVTVNHKNKIPDALLRPGRLDDHVSFNSTDPAYIRELFPNETFPLEQVSTWPMAFVCELDKRARKLGTENALSELPELQQRVEYLLRCRRAGKSSVEEDPYLAADLADLSSSSSF